HGTNSRTVSNMFYIIKINRHRLSNLGPTDSSHRLELATLKFLFSFAKSFFSTESEAIMQVLRQDHQLESEEMVFNRILEDQILVNMRLWSHEENVVHETLKLLSAMTSGRKIVDSLRRNPIIVQLVTHHNEV